MDNGHWTMDMFTCCGRYFRQESSLKKLQEIQTLVQADDHNDRRDDRGDHSNHNDRIVLNVGKMETNNNVYNTLIV